MKLLSNLILFAKRTKLAIVSELLRCENWVLFTRYPITYFAEARIIQKAFDSNWYLEHYPDAAKSNLPAIIHFLKIGWRKDYNPSAEFSVEAYLRNYSDVKQSNVNPLVHYVRYGEKEGRAPFSDALIAEELYQRMERYFDENKPCSSDECWLSIIVPTYNTDPRFLDELFDSFVEQKVEGTELIFTDDCSTNRATLDWLETHGKASNVILVTSAKNSGIAAATNSGIVEAKGEWVTFLDHDDLIAPFALQIIQYFILQNPKLEFVYTDELIVNENLEKEGLFLKPAFDPVLLSGMNYINHFSVYRNNRIREIGYLNLGFDGSQDHDLLLRYLHELSDQQIRHIPYPAYWWRRSDSSYSQTYSEKAKRHARSALARHFENATQKVSISDATDGSLHRVNFCPNDDIWPLISVIIPNLNSFKLIERILADIFQRTNYENLEVIVIDNGSTDAEVLKLYKNYEYKFSNFQAVIKSEPFNFSRSINKGIVKSTGDHILLLNNDIEIIEPDWLKEMVSCLAYDNVGIVGAKLLYPNDTIQHVGVIAGFGGLAGHWYLNTERGYGGPMNRLHVRNSMTCVTGAVMLISGDCLQRVGLFDEEGFSIAYNDVDYCLRAYKLKFRTVMTPFSTLYHHESLSRGSDETPENKDRFDREKTRLADIHGTTNFIDPALHPYLSRNRSTPTATKVNLPLHARSWFGS